MVSRETFGKNILWNESEMQVDRGASQIFFLYGELLYNVLIKPKTLREDAARYMWNMSAKAECIWCTKRSKCY